MYYSVTRPDVEEPNVESLAPFAISAGDVPETVVASLQPVCQHLQSRGFAPGCCWFRFGDVEGGTVRFWAVLIHESGTAFARVWAPEVDPGASGKVRTAISFLSALRDGNYLISISSDTDLASPPGIEIHQLVGADPVELWDSHWQRLTAPSAVGAVAVATPEAALDVLEGYHRRVRDFYLTDGVFAPAGAETADSALSGGASAARPEPPSAYADVWNEIERHQNKRPSWWNAIVILGVSLLLFYGIGAATWNWEVLWILVPVLLLHEAGHFVAMKAFGYRNLRMFFIPLFGAAVSGRHYNVPGWKKAVVSLAGPVPGILLGVALGVAALIADLDWLMQTALFLFVLNGFNLLPFLPLDGGWIAHAILFSRQPWLDAASRLFASGALVLGGVLLGSALLAMVGIFTLLGIPTAFRIARLAANLRRSGLCTDADNDSLPPETAQRIIEELRQVMPRGYAARPIAQMTLQVFEAVNARPPGLLASLALGTVHAGAFLVALVSPLVFFAIYYFGDAQVRTARPEHPLVVDQIRCLEDAEPPLQPAEAAVSLVATFAQQSEADATFDRAGVRLAPPYRLKQFGRTLILDLPAGDERRRIEHATWLQSQDAEVFDDPRCSVTFCIACVASDEATADAIEAAVNGYFEIPQPMYGFPPWSPSRRLTEEQRLARKTFLRLSRMPSWDDDATLKQIGEQSAQTGADDEAKRQSLFKGYREQIRKLTTKYYEELRAQGPERVDVELIDLYAKRPEPPTPPKPGAEGQAIFGEESKQFMQALTRWHLAVGARLGQLPLDGDRPVSGSDRYCASGIVHRDGRRLQLDELRFVCAYDGVHALAEWLQANGCEEFRYGVGGYRPPKILEGEF